MKSVSGRKRARENKKEAKSDLNVMDREYSTTALPSQSRRAGVFIRTPEYHCTNEHSSGTRTDHNSALNGCSALRSSMPRYAHHKQIL